MPKTRLVCGYHPAVWSSFSPTVCTAITASRSPGYLTTRPYTTQLYPRLYMWYPQFRLQMPVLMGIGTSILFQLLRFSLHPAAAAPFSNWHYPQWRPTRTSHHRSSTRPGDGGALPQRPRPRMLTEHSGPAVPQARKGKAGDNRIGRGSSTTTTDLGPPSRSRGRIRARTRIQL